MLRHTGSRRRAISTCTSSSPCAGARLTAWTASCVGSAGRHDRGCYMAILRCRVSPEPAELAGHGACRGARPKGFEPLTF
jgi:hypothetical protein